MTVRNRYFELRGGLDLVTPPGAVSPGLASDMQNYEITLSGTYRRPDGYERLDGQPAPHLGNAVDYAEVKDLKAVMEADTSGDYPTFVEGELNTTPAELKIPLEGLDLDLGQTFDYENQFALFIHGNPIATYIIGEFQNEAEILSAIEGLVGVDSATVTNGDLVITSVLEPANHEDPSLSLMAADFQDYGSYADSQEGRRDAIQAPPGEGPILGVAVFRGQVICARDNGSNGFLYVSTSSGWSGLTLPNPRPAGGRYRFALGNFTGDPDTEALYVVDGVGVPLEIMGPSFTVSEITNCNVVVGSDTLYPSFVAYHKGHLFVAYPHGSVLHSGIGDPFTWDVNSGAGEIAMGEKVRGILSVQGDALAIGTEEGTRILRGTSAADWQLGNISTGVAGVGWLSDTIQIMGQPIFADKMGIRAMSATDTYGDFAANTLSLPVKPLYDTLLAGGVVCSLVSKSLNQYRLLFSGGHCLTMTGDGEQVLGFGHSKYLFEPSCAAQGEGPNGEELIVVGSEGGMVYRMNVGYNFDGEPIAAKLRLHFNHLGSPRRRKRIRKAVFDMHVPAAFDMMCHYAFDYGGSDHAQAVDEVTNITGGFGIWNVSEWGKFNWGGTNLSEGEVDITGSGRTIALLLYSSGSQIPPYEIDGVHIHYSVRGLRR